MQLIALRDYLQTSHGASLAQLCRHFRQPQSAMRGMLEHWIRKGCVVLLEAPCASSCGQCNGETEWYRWQEKRHRIIPLKVQ